MRTDKKRHAGLTFMRAVCVGALLVPINHFAGPVLDAAESFAESPFSRPAFSASPAELLEWAGKCDYDLGRTDVEILLDEVRCRIDPQGKTTVTLRQIYRCLTRNAFEEGGVVDASWVPWHQDRPTIRARVITPDGEPHPLDENTIEEVQIPSDRANVFTDAKLLRGPLPALTTGCVVETEVVTCEHKPFSAAGAYGSLRLGDLFAPTRHVHVVLEVPATMPVEHRVLRSDAVAVVTHEGDYQVVTLSFGPVPAFGEKLEAYLPGDIAPVPFFAFSTCPSWQGVAKEYAAIVEQQLAGNDLAAVARSVLGPGEGKEPREVARLLLDFIRQRTRYAAVSFGSARIVPQKPQDTLARQYGDCKDLATLYVGLLRAAGVPADVALVNAGPGMDMIPDLPGLNGFDHAIVRVRGDTPLWIDPTGRYSPFGELPVHDQGRVALVAHEATGELIQTPRSAASENCLAASYTVTMSDTSLAKITAVTTYRGAFAPSVRASYAAADEKQRRQWLRQMGLDAWGTDKLVHCSCTDPEDLGSPFQVTTEFENASLAWAEHPNAWALLPLSEPVAWLPLDVTGPPDAAQTTTPEDGHDQSNQRVSPLQLPFPGRYEIEYRVVPAPGFAPVKRPDDQAMELGSAKLEVTYRTEADNSVTVRVVLDSGNGLFTADAVTESRQKIQSLADNKGYETWRATIQFEQAAGKHLEAGRLREAVVAYHELLTRHPDEFVRHVQFARAVLRLGLGDLARTHARRAVELAPAESYAWATLGCVLAHNPIGQYLSPGLDRAGAAEAYRKALEIAPDDISARWELGNLLTRDEHGLRYANPEYVDAAIVELTAAYEKHKDETLLNHLVAAMLIRDKTEDAKRLLERASAGPTRDAYLLVTIALTEGVDASLQRAGEMRPAGAQRQLLLEQLTSTLDYFRNYQTAVQLAERLAADPSGNGTQLEFVEVIRLLSRYDAAQERDDDPVGLARRVLANALARGATSSQLRQFYANVPDDDDGSFDAGLPFWVDLARKAPSDQDYPATRIADIVTGFEFQMLEDGTDCHRVLAKHRSLSALTWTAIVVRGEQGLRLFRTGYQQSELGRQALDLLAKGHEDEARRWLDWAYKEQPPESNAFTRLFDQFADSPFARLWAMAKKDQRDVQLAAAALAMMGDSQAQPLAILEANRTDLEVSRQLQVDRALADGYRRAGEYQKLASLSARMREKHPKAYEPAAGEMLARARLGEFDAVEKLIAGYADSTPVRVWGQLSLAEAATAAGDDKKAEELLSVIAQQRDSNPPVAAIWTAWLSQFQHPAPQDALARAEDALKQTQSLAPEDRPNLGRAARRSYVLALIDAGQLAEAVDALYAMPAVDQGSRADNFDKLALACIADQCGLHEHAQRLLQEVKQGKSRDLNSIFDLAQKRLKWKMSLPH